MNSTAGALGPGARAGLASAAQTGGSHGQLWAYNDRRTEEAAFADKGLAVQLENMELDESGHSEETERTLRDWPL